MGAGSSQRLVVVRDVIHVPEVLPSSAVSLAALECCFCRRLFLLHTTRVCCQEILACRQLELQLAPSSACATPPAINKKFKMATRTVSINTSAKGAERSGVIKMPTYTIQEDAPWLQSSRVSAAPSSVYSDDFEPTMPAGEITPLSGYSATCYAHPNQVITDDGPQNRRASRMPVFKQVRTMLKKQPSNLTKWDDMTGEPSEHGKTQKVKPSAYVSPWEGAFQARRFSPERKASKSQKSRSPVSILRDEEITSGEPLNFARNTPRSVSPVSTTTTAPSLAPSQVSVNLVSQPPLGLNLSKHLKRKPIKKPDSPSASENIPPPELRAVDSRDTLTVDEPVKSAQESHFSWSTVAPSFVSKRESTNPSATHPAKRLPDSHFSWTTVATNTTYTGEEDSEPPSPVPPIPQQYLEPQEVSTPPMQSILSRKRPVQRLDKEEWTPSAQSPLSNSRTTTPITMPARTTSLAARTPTTTTTTPNPSSGAKALPLPPFTTEAQATHLQQLLNQEQNLLLQRRNIEKAIMDLERVEKASPLDVSFAQVRDARKKLEERRLVLSEVKREEMELGIKIARARRKEDFGEGEGTLWVRRVTG